ncbi:ubiquinone/menaquinone biosynthesis protein [Streptacidiphilus pinicola]|uniref:Ubiquinone/menaquinone biosynthesis protein n=1 Tax=Streptacidiphilus pinicola TaxID=2219663 RepID=A0A2X0KII4_9ACTN|nr:methyltransferase domain-containing protein [Streptacidiphilus pinicola]RAG86839.1 ubiquinone/menaquinone biosynthesis protein [Streptacidiphilus pinicola]
MNPHHAIPHDLHPRPANTGTLNAFSDVDASGRAAELGRYLDHAHRGLHAPKGTLRAGLGVRPGGRVLDLGCGTGHELAQLQADGFHAVGVDLSAELLRAGRERLHADGHPVRLAVADGGRLPFADASFDGCRIERVLQHVPDPAAVLREVRRVLRPGGAVAVLEPDWASFAIAATDRDTARAVADAVGADIAHRDVGRHLRRLLVDAGLTEVRVEVELVAYGWLEELANVVDLRRAASRAVADGTLDRARAEAFLTEQQLLSDAGAFHASLNRSVLAWARRSGA